MPGAARRPARFPQQISARSVVTNLYVLKCRPEKVPQFARSVPQRLRVVYGALRAEFCVLGLACGALRAELCERSFGYCARMLSFAC